MKPFVWNPNLTTEETKDGAYWERNMLALTHAIFMNDVVKNMIGPELFSICPPCGWYKHEIGPGWSRVISINNGAVTFHVPDDFDLGTLPQIEPNWDGHTTEQKWLNLMDYCGVKVDGVS